MSGCNDCVQFVNIRSWSLVFKTKTYKKNWPGLGKTCGLTSIRQDVIQAHLTNPCRLRSIMCSHVGRCNRKSVVKLVFLYVVFLSSLPVLQGLALSDLYPFGKAASDNKTERTDDGGSHKILLKNPFKFFGRNKSSLFVSIPKCLGAFGVEYAITSARQNIWIKYTDWLDFGLSWLNRWFYSRYFNPTLLY